MKESQYKKGENFSFCKCLLLSCSDLDIELGTVMRSREIYNFMHKELAVKQRKETISISRGYTKKQVNRSALC